MTKIARIGTAEPLHSPAEVYLLRLRPGKGRTGAHTALVRFLRLLGATAIPHTYPWHTLARHDLMSAFAHARRYAPASQLLTRAAVRGVLKECRRQRLISAEALADLTDDWPKIRNRRPPPGRALEPGEVRLLFACATTREAALLAVLLSTGVRCAEAAALQVRDYDPKTGRLDVHEGKGGIYRRCYVGTVEARTYLNRWLDERGKHPGRIFNVGPQVVWQMVRDVGRRAGVARFSTHDLRRTAITRLLDLGTDLDAVRQFAGHENVQTTLKYRRTRKDVVREAAAQLKLF